MEPASERHFPCSDAFCWSLLAAGLCTALLACNKQINAEAKGISYRKNLLVVPFSYIIGRMIAANFGTSQISLSSRFSREPYIRLSSALLQRLRLSSRLRHSHNVGTVAASGHRESALKFLANSTATSENCLDLVKRLEHMEFGEMCLDLMELPAMKGKSEYEVMRNGERFDPVTDVETDFMQAPRTLLSPAATHFIRIPRNSLSPIA